jgi:hypothetical protein
MEERIRGVQEEKRIYTEFYGRLMGRDTTAEVSTEYIRIYRAS